ncbi:MAG: hypothetical protein N0A16_04025 [Blastocatellia bacterium]|nr:hypothetical protein [Blastocatellia bacterium]
MKRNIWMALVVSLAMSLAMMGPTSWLLAQEVTVVGEIVDWNCYTKDAKNKGAAHRACAINCAKAGAPLGIVDEKTGELYKLAGEAWTANKNEKLIPFVAERVTIKGKVEKKEGVKVLTILSVEKAK